ncbi:MAG TPA: T9SS type A sorting domain-containing protein [bacterium (Candidatus Stahlbacteria)]|nr:T9SS type A sorting domain-containing protein [Candidatus Stahlbacteria bacterium]
MVNKHWIVALGLLTLVGSISAKVMNVENNWGNRGYNLVSSTKSGVEIVFSVDLWRLVETEVDGKTMYTVTIPGGFLPNTEGTPNLPSVGRFIAIPEGARAMVTILDKRTEVIKDVEIAPAPPLPKESDPYEPPYRKNSAIYYTNVYYPDSPVKVSEPMEMRGVDCITIGVCPFQYNPVTKELVVYKDLRVRVDFVGGNGHFGEDNLRNRFFEPILKEHLINYSMLPKLDLYNLRQGDIDYAIIVPNDAAHQAWADTIMHWRKLQGIQTETYTLSQIGGNNATLIERFLDSLYTNHNLVAFLLLSDYQSSGMDAYGITSPIWNSYCVSDNKYADTDGDSLPDMFHGRFTSHDNTHLSRMVGKMLSNERQPESSPTAYERPLFACGWQTPRWFQLCTEIVRRFMCLELGKDSSCQYAIYSGSPYPGCSWSTNQNTYMLIDYFGPNGLNYIPSTNPHNSTFWDTGTYQGINREINAGTFLVQHRDHGTYSGWGEPYYRITHLQYLNNIFYPFVFSINCLTGTYNYSSEVFAEAFHRMVYGALGVNAASETSYSFVNDTYIFGLYDLMFPYFMPDYPLSGSDAEPSFYYGNNNPGFGMVSGKYFLHQSNWPYLSYYYKVITFHLFHHHTDPFVTIFSEVPESLTVSHANQLPAGQTTFTVTANDSSLIALTVNGEIIGVAEGTGSPVVITIPPQSAGETMIVTVTLYNHYRYEKAVPVIGSEVTEEPVVTESRVWLNQTVINDRLVVNYALSNREQVKVSLFDATGRMIREINSKLKGKGAVTLNTSGISAGVYFVRIEKGNEVTTNQVILVR